MSNSNQSYEEKESGLEGTRDSIILEEMADQHKTVEMQRKEEEKQSMNVEVIKTSDVGLCR